MRRIDARRLHNAALLGNVAEENGQPAVLAEGVLQIADHAAGAIHVQLIITGALAEGLGSAHAARSGAIELGNRGCWRAFHIQLVDGFADRRRMNGVRGAMQQSGAIQLGKYGEDSAGAMHIFQMHAGRGRGHLAKIGNAAREAVDVGHRKGRLALLRHRQQMQNRVRRAAHRDVQRHGILEGLKARNRARQHAFVALLVVALGQIDDGPPRTQEDFLAVAVRGQHGSVSRQPQAQSLD